MTESTRTPTARRPWWKHPAFVIAVVVVVVAAVAVVVWLAQRDEALVARVEVDGPDTVRVGEPFTIGATALDESGSPVSGLELTLESAPELATQPQERLVTGEDGTVTFEGLEADEAGTHAIVVTVDGASDDLRVQVVEPEGRLQMSAPSEVAVDEEFAVQVSFFRRGEPARQEDVTVSVEPDGPVQRVETDANGQAEAVFADGVPEPGEYTLLAMSAEGTTQTSQPLVVNAASQPVNLRGETGRTTEPFSHPGGLARFEFEYQGAGPFSVDVRTPEGRSVATVAQADGAVTGSDYAGLEQGRYVLAVEADGSWSVQYSAPVHRLGDALPVSYEGEGPTAVEPPFEHDGDAVTFEYRHDGEGGFTVEVLNADTGEVVATVADTSGQTDGTTEERLDAGVYVLDVDADGEWAVEVR